MPPCTEAAASGKSPSTALAKKLEKQAADAAKAAAKKKAEDEQKRRSDEAAARQILYPLPSWEDLYAEAVRSVEAGDPDKLILYHILSDLKTAAAAVPPVWPPKDPSKVRSLPLTCCTLKM